MCWALLVDLPLATGESGRPSIRPGETPISTGLSTLLINSLPGVSYSRCNPSLQDLNGGSVQLGDMHSTIAHSMSDRRLTEGRVQHSGGPEHLSTPSVSLTLAKASRRLLRALAVLGFLDDAVYGLGDVPGKVVERGDHVGALGLQEIRPVPEPRNLLPEHLILDL